MMNVAPRIESNTIEGVSLRQASHFSAAGGLVHAFATRHGGVSCGIYESMNLGVNRGDDRACVMENYRRFSAAVGFSMDRLVFCPQIHSDIVHLIADGDIGKGLSGPAEFQADGLMTNKPGVAVATFYADCTPILLYDPVARAVASVHSGWRGTAQNIAGKAVLRMGEAFGTKPGDLLAAIGPCISECCFETGDDVPDAMRKFYGSAVDKWIFPQESGKYKLDLKSIIRTALCDAGVLPHSIAVSDECTMCKPETFWSHRVAGDARGSLCAVICLV